MKIDSGKREKITPLLIEKFKDYTEEYNDDELTVLAEDIFDIIEENL